MSDAVTLLVILSATVIPLYFFVGELLARFGAFPREWGIFGQRADWR